MQSAECRVKKDRDIFLYSALCTHQFALTPPSGTLIARIHAGLANQVDCTLSVVDNPPPQADVRVANHGEGFGVVG